MRPIDNINDLKRLKYYFNNQSERNRMLFNLLLETGYRIGDVVDLYIGDIRKAIEDRSFKIREKKIVKMKKAHCKNRGIVFKESDVEVREIPIPIDFAKELKKYIKDKSDSEYAFPSRVAGKHITEDTFGKILSKAGKECKIKEPICNHTLRKTFIYNCYIINNYNIKLAQKMAGHSSSETTKLYIGEDEILCKRTMETMHQLLKSLN